ncbi:MAG: MFS transporter [Nitrososphaeria archaeon]
MSQGHVLSKFDELRLTGRHIRISLVAGMGFFTDAYDLFSISVVLYILTVYPESGFPLHLKLLGMPLSVYLATSAIFFAIIGQLLFGYISDRLGRKKIYGLEAALLSVGALLSALAPNIYWLIASRALLGIGIGGDYPVSSVIASEYGNAKDRGKMIALVFSNQGLGILSVVAAGIISSYLLPPSLAWRAVLGLGAIPGAAVIYARRRMPETPRYSYHVKGNAEELERAARYMGISYVPEGSIRASGTRRYSTASFIRQYWKALLVTTSTWFLMDVALYGTGVYSTFITSSILPRLSAESLRLAIFLGGLPYLVGLPGYFSAVALIDRLGRKSLQTLGFTLMAAVYAVTAATLSLVTYAPVAFSLFALSFYAINLGPNTTTFVIPAEIYPTERRSTGHGISAAAGKLGAAISTLLMPAWKAQLGLPVIFAGLAAISVAGAAITMALPEPRGVPLEVISERVASASGPRSSAAQG